MDDITDTNVLANGTNEIPAKQNKSSGMCRFSPVGRLLFKPDVKI